MMLLGITSLAIYNIFLFLTFKKVFPPKRSRWFYYAAAIAINIGGAAASEILDLHQFGVFLMMGTMMLSFHLLFHGNNLQVIYAGCIYMFSFYTSKGIVASVYSLIFSICIHDILHQDTYHYMTVMIAALLSILTIFFTRKVAVPDKGARLLLINRVQLKFIDMSLALSLLYLVIISCDYFLNLTQCWFAIIFLVSCVMCKLGMLVVHIYKAKVSEMFEYELHTRQFQEHLARQVRHYKSYRKFTESYRAFRHDYTKLMTSVKTLLQNQEVEKAALMLDEIHDTMQKDVQIHKTYSDNIFLDAILQDAANKCEENSIRFTAIAHLPENIAISELDIVRVFTNAIDNALEACDKIPQSERFIKISSENNPDWVAIEISNSFNGELLYRNDELVTTKNNKDFHGLGLMIIGESIEKLGGLILIEPDREHRVFLLRLCIPKKSD